MGDKTIDQMRILFYTDNMLHPKLYQKGHHKLSDIIECDNYCPLSMPFDIVPEVRVCNTIDGGTNTLEDVCLRVQSARDVYQTVIMQD